MNVRYVSWIFVGMVGCLLSAGPPLALGQSADAEAELTPATAEPVSERTVYVPYWKMKEVFERDGRGVFLPYDEFQALWKAAHVEPVEEEVSGPPAAAIVTSISSEATVGEDVVQVDAQLTIELLQTGWISVPLHLANSAIQSATIDGRPAHVTQATEGGYQLWIQHASSQPQQIQLDLTYVRAFEKAPGQNSVSFAAPQAPVNRWKIRIPQPGVQVQVTPMIAATQAAQPARTPATSTSPNAQADDTTPTETAVNSPDVNDAETNAAPNAPTTDELTPAAASAEETVLWAFVGSAANVAIRWTPKSEGASGLTALTSVQAEQELWISDGAVRSRAVLTYNISRAQLQQLSVELPADYKVVSVFDPNIRKWDVLRAEEGEPTERQQIQVELFEPASTSQQLTIELERFIDAAAAEQISVPNIRAVDVGRQQGVVAVRAEPTLRVEAQNREGLLQIDTSELPPQLANQSCTFAYRYASMPFELDLSVEKIEPRIGLTQLVEAYLEPERLSLDISTVFNIERAGVFQLEMHIPDGFEIVQVQGRVAEGVAAAAIDSFQLTGDNLQRLQIQLARKTEGVIGVIVQLRRQLDDENLLRPTGQPATLQLELPAATQPFSEDYRGTLVVYGSESLRMQSSVAEGLRAIAFSEALEKIPTFRPQPGMAVRPTLAFAYADQGGRLELTAERRNPYVAARQVLSVSVQSGVARFDSRIFYDVRYSGIDSLRLDVPASLVDQLRNLSPGLRESVIQPPPEDVPPDYVALQLKGESELLGELPLQLSWEQKLGELPVGGTTQIVVPHLQPMNVDRSWGQIVVTKTETLDVEPAALPTGLRPIDPVHDVMPEAKMANAAQAYEFYDDWQLVLKATRYQLEEVKRTSIERGLVRTVVTRSERQSTQAVYRLRSALQRLSIRLPERAEFDTQPARVNGLPVPLERGDQGLLFVPLIGLDPQSDFLLELRYTLPGDATQINIPVFPDDPAVQKVYLAVYLPEELSLLHSSGPWTEEFQWKQPGLGRRLPVPQLTEQQLIAWVTDGLTTSPSPTFQTDGTLYLFSALSPVPPPDGLLELTALHENTLGVSVLAGFALVGLLFLRSPLERKLAVLAGLLILAVACGLLTPTLGQQLLNLPFIAGLAIVGIAWTSWYAARGVRRRASAPREPAVSTVTASNAEPIPPDSPPKNQNVPPPKSDAPSTPEGDSHE